MQSSVSTSEELTKHYTTAIDALCEIASACCALGRVGDVLAQELQFAYAIARASESLERHTKR